MGVFGNEQQLCPCHKKHQEFHKLIEFQDLVVYSHRIRAENVKHGEAVKSAANKSRYVFILHNKKDVKITTSELKSESGKKNISCPRCRKTFEHAQKLMQDVKSVDKRTVMGICDHCRKNAQTGKNPFCACEEIVKKFISAEGKQKGDTDKQVKIWLSKMGQIEDSEITPNKAKQIKTQTYSKLQISQDLDSRTPRHEPKVEQMFYSDKHFQSDDTEMSETDLQEDSITQTVTFTKPIETVETSLPHTSHGGEIKKTIIPGTSIADSTITIAESYVGVKDLPRPSLKDRKQEEIFQDDIPSMDAKEVLKRRHDLSLRQMMRYKREADDPFSLTDKPDMYDIPKNAPWEQKELTLEYHVEPKIDISPTRTKYDLGPRVTPDPDYVSTRPSQKILQDQYVELGKVDKYHHDKMKKEMTSSGERQKVIKKREESYILGDTLRLRRSVNKFGYRTKKLDHRVEKSKSGPTQTFGNITGPQYSFYFPKEKKEVKTTKLNVTSSQLIRDTQEKFRLQDEKEKKRKEEEHQRKLEQEEKNKLAREEKKQQAEEKRRQAIETQKYAEEQKGQTQEKKISEKSLDPNESQHTKKGESDKELDEINEDKKSKKSVDVKSKTTGKDDNEATKKEQKLKSALKKSKAEKPQQKTKDDQISKGKDETKVKDDELSQKNKKLQKEKEEQLKQEKLQKEKENKEKLKQEQLEKEKLKQEQLEKEKLKQEQLQKEKENKEKLKQEKLQKEKEKEEKKKEAQLKEIDAASKKEQPAKKKRDSSDEIKASMQKKRSSIDKQGTGTIKKEEKVKESKRETSKKEPPAAPTEPVDEYQKLQADRLKDKEEAAKIRKQKEAEALAAKAKAEAERKAKAAEIKMKDIKIPKKDDLETLRMVRIRQAAAMRPCDIEPELLDDHKCHHNRRVREFCPLCLNSELELEVLSLDNKIKRRKDKITDIIIGEEIYKYKPQPKKTKEKAGVPMLFRKDFTLVADQEKPKEVEIIIPKQKTPVEVESTKGILQYALSDRTFIEKGWTLLPTEKVMRKMNVYRMRPAHPEFDWFKHNKKKRLMTYDTGEKLAEFDDNGRGRLYYKNGRLALDYYDAKETNAQQRFVTYSSGEPDERGRTHPITILATFDYLGNGIVFDHAGKIRLKYNQTEGVVLDRGIGPVSHWKWHSLNDPPVLQQVMIDTQMAQKDPDILKLGPPNEKTTRPDNEEMLAIEFDNFIKEKSKKLSQKFKPFQIKMKALKINEHFSLKVLDQATVYLIFRDGSTNVKLNIGMILDHQEIVDTDTAEVGDVANNMERFPARTDSLAGLQRSVAHAQRYERQYTERQHRLRPPEPCGSADKLTAAASRPMRPPLTTIPPVATSSSTSTGYCSRKPANNLYYNTRLL